MSKKAEEFNEDLFAGLTPMDCPIDCTLDRCVVTEDGICGHPKKSGLQAPHRMKPDVVARYNEARKRLYRATEEKKFA